MVVQERGNIGAAAGGGCRMGRRLRESAVIAAPTVIFLLLHERTRGGPEWNGMGWNGTGRDGVLRAKSTI